MPVLFSVPRNLSLLGNAGPSPWQSEGSFGYIEGLTPTYRFFADHETCVGLLVAFGGHILFMLLWNSVG